MHRQLWMPAGRHSHTALPATGRQGVTPTSRTIGLLPGVRSQSHSTPLSGIVLDKTGPLRRGQDVALSHLPCRRAWAALRTRTQGRRTFIAFSFEALAICTAVCFHDHSNASTEEVHMNIHSTNRQMPKLCADAAAADLRALLG